LGDKRGDRTINNQPAEGLDSLKAGFYIIFIVLYLQNDRNDVIFNWITTNMIGLDRSCNVSVEKFGRISGMGMKLNEIHFVEDTGLFFERMGLPRMAGRILGVLLIARPPVQSINDLATELSASKSSISITARYLVDRELIERVPGPAARQDYYRFKPGGWIAYLKDWLGLMSALHQITERGLALLIDEPEPMKERLLEAHDLFSLLEEHFPLILDRLAQEREARLTSENGLS
jgi:hypothetical protein